MNILVEKITKDNEVKQKKSCVYFLWFIAVLTAFLSEASFTSSLIKDYSLTAFVYAIPATAFAWASVHERAKGEMLKFGWSIGILFLSPIFFPLYLVSEKGLKEGVTTTLKSIVVVFIALLLFAVSSVFFELIIKNT